MRTGCPGSSGASRSPTALQPATLKPASPDQAASPKSGHGSEGDRREAAPRTSGLELLQLRPYLASVPWDYGDKRARNKRIGPGGGTRRLHQTSLVGGTMGPKQDRRTSKGVSFRSVRYHRYRSKHDSCQRQPCSGRRCRLSGNQTENLKPCSSSKGRRGSQAPGNRSLHFPSLYPCHASLAPGAFASTSASWPCCPSVANSARTSQVASQRLRRLRRHSRYPSLLTVQRPGRRPASCGPSVSPDRPRDLGGHARNGLSARGPLGAPSFSFGAFAGSGRERVTSGMAALRHRTGFGTGTGGRDRGMARFARKPAPGPSS